MSAQTNKTNLPEEKIIDDLVVEAPSINIDQEKLAKLKAKLAEKTKETETMSVKTNEKKRSINFGVIGTGQAGSRLAAAFREFNAADCICLNTTVNDLKHIDVPESNKLLLEYSIGGAAKTLSIGREAAEANRDKIKEMVGTQLSDAQVYVLCSSLGGGSGAGSIDTVVDILHEFEKPIIVIGVLPMHSEDVKSKSNSMETLSSLSKQLQSNKIANIILVDNARIESIYHNVGQMQFYGAANEAIVSILDVFNTLSATPSPVKSMDSMEFARLLCDAGGYSTYGSMEVENYTDESAIAEAVLSNMNNNLLASGFNIKESKYVGFIVAANAAVWKDVPAVSVNFAVSTLTEQCGSPVIYRGIYEIEEPRNVVKVYSFFSGLGIPSERTNQLSEEVRTLENVVKEKDVQRNLNITLNTGKSATVSDVQKIKDKLAAKTSTFGKFVGANVVDKRK